MKKPIGILITNIGTPDSPTIKDVRRYLKSFLSDHRIVRLPRILWLPFLHLFILHLRTPYSAQLYQNIWTAEGSPLKTAMQRLTAKLETYLTSQWNRSIAVEYGMHYGNPSILEAIERLYSRNIEELLVLPLFPQYSSSTTETTYEQVKQALKKIPHLDPKYIAHYAEHPSYIAAVAQQIKAYYSFDKYLLFSFHGIPQQFVDRGDPYAEFCYKTANSIASALGLSADQWSVAYQSRFGYAKWLKPYTFDVLKELPQRGIRDISIICPGFAVDCLETLEEIQIRGQKEFLLHGGQSFQYIPALNDSESHVISLGEICNVRGGANSRLR